MDGLCKQGKILSVSPEKGQNPCCNGWSLQGFEDAPANTALEVRILVVMDGLCKEVEEQEEASASEGQNPCCNGWSLQAMTICTLITKISASESLL